jgi:cytochrome c2
MKKVVFLLVAGALILACAAIVVAADAAHGKEVYAAQKCQLCHSIAKVGNPKYPLDGVGAKQPPDKIKGYLKGWITEPKKMDAKATMPAKAGLPAKDLDDLVEYLSTLK